jgi:hypothetical protein
MFTAIRRASSSVSTLACIASAFHNRPYPEPDRPPPSDFAARPFFLNGRGGVYGFHFTGVTANAVPFAELTQPAAVSLLGSFSG